MQIKEMADRMAETIREMIESGKLETKRCPQGWCVDVRLILLDGMTDSDNYTLAKRFKLSPVP